MTEINKQVQHSQNLGKRRVLTMTGKEMALPLGVTIGLIINAVVVGQAWGKMDARTQAVTEIRETVKDIQRTLKDQDDRYMRSDHAMAEYGARLAVLEKAADTQAGINIRIMGHLEANGSNGK